jgi:hypothetical protein
VRHRRGDGGARECEGSIAINLLCIFWIKLEIETPKRGQCQILYR